MKYWNEMKERKRGMRREGLRLEEKKRDIERLKDGKLIYHEL